MSKCVICKKKFEPESDEQFCSRYECEEKYWDLEDAKSCADPIIRGRLREGRLETMRLGTAWGIGKQKIPKRQLLELKKKYEPERYGLVKETSKPTRRPRSEA